MSLTSTESIIISIAAGVVGGLIATLMIDLGKIALDKFFGIKTGAAALVPEKLLKSSKEKEDDGHFYVQKEFIRNRRVTTAIRRDGKDQSGWNIPWKDRKRTDYAINYSQEEEDDGHLYTQWELGNSKKTTVIVRNHDNAQSRLNIPWEDRKTTDYKINYSKVMEDDAHLYTQKEFIRDGKKTTVIVRDVKDQSDWNIPWKDRKTTNYLINYSEEKDDGHRYTQWELIRDGKKTTVIVRNDARSDWNIPWKDRKTTNYKINYSKEDDGHFYTQWELIRDGKKATIIKRDDDAQSDWNIPWKDRKTTNYRIGKDHA